ncbi:T9SS type B sorting domain-containing protein [Flavobacterium noncentrifugens]|uniref:Gliding motility-associated C-terminal domain-containing protein n=1 Tax=Flavobacterium noncentrifugens TaxID=1128970 RepID=A0A1G8Y7M4_9FLAO|nr:T9SS type B sorting domain-containing protein [Flavobacterium noncentrifugens]SDJ98090.1 gliding motility-associated C-terminal domain-containing protein [Flavobacterium noncentrifugens]
MRHLYKIIFLFIAWQAQAQLETAHWKFGQFAGLNFTSGAASVTSGSLYTNEGCASISDKCGNLLFYTDGKMLLSKDNSVMQNGNALLGDASSTQSAIIIPKPDNPNIYYVFTTYSLNGMHYSVVDLSLNGGLGAVVAGQKNIPLPLSGVQKGSEKLTAVAKADHSGYWVITHYLNRYYSFSVTAAGVNISPVVSQVGVNVPDKVNDKFFYTYAIGQLKASPDGTKLAAAHFTAIKASDFSLFPVNYFTPGCALTFTYGGVLGLYDFDNATGIVSNETVLNSLSSERRTYYGVEFSPDSKVLYSSYDVYNFASACGDLYEPYKVSAAIDKYDLTAVSVPASENTLFQQADLSKSLAGSLQLALDGRIYHAMYNSLSYITNPNDYATAAFHPSGVSIVGCTLGLPPFIASLFDPKILINGEFDTNTFCLGTNMLLSYEGCPDTIIGWNFGDGNTSAAISPTHTYANSGTYTITLTITTPGGLTETKTRQVEIKILTPTFNAISPICQGTSLPALPTISLEGITGTWSPAPDNSQTTIYNFTPDTGQCATGQTLTIAVNLPVTPTFNSVSPICAGDSLPALPTVSLEGITGIWSPIPDNSQTTTYTFTPDAGQCAVGQTLTIAVNLPVTPTFNSVSPICTGATLTALSTVSLEGITGTWAPALDNSQTTTYTFTPATGQCATTQTLTITVNLPVTPTFNSVPAVCAGDPLPALPAVSLESITGTWSPALDNTQTTTYTFTPDSGQCATVQTLTIAVNLPVTPTFNSVSPICSGTTLTALPMISSEGITGTWAPALDNTQTTTYSFTPDVGQCAIGQTLTITVNPSVVPTFNSVPPICAGDSLPPLSAISLESITGTWSPALDNLQTTTYTFTPNVGQCATSQTLTIAVNPLVTPTFNSVPPICAGTLLPALPTVSLNGITGIWSPALDNTQTTIYTFTPNGGQCATGQTLTITVNPSVTPIFNTVAPICSGEALPALPIVSLNGITGTWSPAPDNSQTTTYIFTPDAGQCTTAAVSLRVVVNPLMTPVFGIGTNYCQNAVPDILPVISSNGITGTWFPERIDTSSAGTAVYVFLPDAGQCNTGKITLNITVTGSDRPVFNITTSYCQNAVPENLPNISDNGIIGNWSHAAIDTSNPGMQTYVFTPDSGVCSVISHQFELTVEVAAITTPVFNLITDYYFLDSLQILPTVSDNGIAGTWYPSGIAATASATGTYMFVPDSDQCSEVFSVAIKVINYPKIFTPNNDGYHDSWNISALQSQPTAKITIYDRYGKILASIKVQDQGWDGTYKGQPMPSDDYWFVLTYMNSMGVSREFKAHFALKR